MNSTVHQTLLCSDVSAKVFDFLAPGPKPSQTDHLSDHQEWQLCRRTLLALAQSHSAFTEPALDILWRVVEDLTNLLGILPDQSVNGYMLTVKRPRDEQWRRFQEYASRVRWLRVLWDVRSRNRRIPHHTTWDMLKQQCSGGPLLPRLTRLTIKSTHVAASSILLSPSVTRLEIVDVNPVKDLMNVSFCVDAIQRHTSHIKSLTLHPLMLTELGVRSHPTLDLSVLAHLQMLRINSPGQPYEITMPFLTAIMSFPILRELEFNLFFSAGVRSSLSAKKLPVGFFDLRVLHLMGTPSDITLFFEATDPPGLDSVSLSLREPERNLDHTNQNAPSTIEQLHELCSHIPTPIHRLDLCISSFSFAYTDWHRTFDFMTSHMPLSPLRDLHGLREASIIVRDTLLALSAHTVLLALSTAWPELTHFQFFHWGERRSAGSPAHLPTFATMLAFVQAHPRLSHIELTALNANGIPDIGASLGPQYPLRHVWIERLVPNTPVVELAIALDSVFPNLDLGSPAAVRIKRSRAAGETVDSFHGGPGLGDGLDCFSTFRVLLLTLQTSRRSGVSRPDERKPSSD